GLENQEFSLGIQQQVSYNSSMVRYRPTGKDYGMKEIKNLSIKVEDSSLEENNHPPKIFDKVSNQVPEKVKEDKNLVNIDELRKWANLLRKKAKVLACNMKEKEIQSKVESRFSINRDRKKMLLSLLNKLANKIKIDRVLKEEKNFYQNSELVVKEMEKEKYRTKSWIDPSWYQNILDPVQEGEWLAALNKAHNKIVPGVSGIGFIFLKKVSVETTKEFIKFANMVLEKGKFSRKWKLAQLFLIPKTNFWDITKNDILKGTNFAGLSGKSTVSFT
ncbi:33225_t:CDS:2, partial [Gigaspora margarita]